MQRNQSLDALRGFAIFAMVLSGSIAYNGTLPGWMYHAQVPPPLFRFNPNLPGITWVDLVFPFFLLSMGAAIPLALQKKEPSNFTVFWIAWKRFVLLAFFAIFFEHTKAWVITKDPQWPEWMVSIAAFILIIYQYKKNEKTQLDRALKVISFIAGLALLACLPFRSDKGFDLYKSDIIILVLANMAFFGTIIWWFTRNSPWIRIGILPCIMGVFFAASEPSASWAKTIYQWDAIGSFKIKWLYQFYFLKYLFIILPGTFVGEYLIKKNKTPFHKNERMNVRPKIAVEGLNIPWIPILILLLVIVNLYALWNRYLFPNLIISLFLLFVLHFIYKKYHPVIDQFLLKIATYLLILGLIWEPFQGGIKKDSSTYSYYFLTSGLAILSLLFFEKLRMVKFLGTITKQFAAIGTNPLMAYILGSLLLLPLLHLTQLFPYWDNLHHTALLGFLKGIIFTLTVCWITNRFTKNRIILKT